MKLFLLRHADALYGGPDPDRPLSETGRLVSLRLARFVHQKPYFSFKEIWCSPYRRARETAEPLVSMLPSSDCLRFKEFLTPLADPRDVVHAIKNHKNSLLLVGHNPHLADLSSYLLGLNRSCIRLPVKKGALVVFKESPESDSGFVLSAYLPPSALGFKD